ncbi:MAG TPA: hypothetical protein VEX12_09105 [Microbacterium sp.]|nr:hypothetical protein [Microbacterium sp.]
MSDRGEITPPAPRGNGSPAVPRPPLPPYAAAVAAAAPARTPQPPSIADSQSTTEVFATDVYPTDTYPTAVYAPAAQPQSPPAYEPPMHSYATPPHVYAPPSGYAAPPQGYGPYVPVARVARAAGSSGLGVVAFLLAVLAAVGATILGSIAAYRIGLGTGREIALRPLDIDFDWSILAPVREWVLVGEVAFWVGTVLGIWALVQGIVAIVKGRGRGWAVAAVVLAVLGPIAFATGVLGFLVAGFASGATGS